MYDGADLQVLSQRIHQVYMEVVGMSLTDLDEVEARLQQGFAEFGLQLSTPVVGALARGAVAAT